MTKQQFFFRIFETVIKTVGVLIGFKWGVVGVATSVVITNFIAKIVKIIYIGEKVDVAWKECVGLFLSSWRFALLLVPVCMLAMFLLPNTWGGDIALAVVFALLTIAIFMFMPRLVGERYEDEVYAKVMPIVKQKLHIEG